jgi:RNA polymerase sigma-70 factor (ECF subfamily)
VTAAVELVHRAQAGDADAFAQIYAEHRAYVHTVIRRRVASPETAEDLTQDVFVRVLRGIGQWSDQGKNITAWLATIAINIVRDYHRRASLRPTRGLPECDDFVLDMADDSAGPEEIALGWVTVAELHAGLARLSPAKREVIVSRFLLDRSLKETAARTGHSRQAVAMLTHRALAALRGAES